ncbi:MAG: four helix bundle protein, partial [bacterium]|nr:four helix bundle protein [bacterium]
MAAIKDVSEIRVYQHALALYPDVIYLVSLIPENYRKQRDQLLNSSVAIAPLIAEGFAKKRNNAEVKRFFEMAMAESDELITHLRMVKSLA